MKTQKFVKNIEVTIYLNVCWGCDAVKIAERRDYIDVVNH